MDRRDFLKAGLVLGGAAALGGCRLFPLVPGPTARTHSIIDGAPGDSGIDTVVVCMMENRSFDSYLGWLARDEQYLELGRRRYGNGFTVNGRSFQT
ncbi:MAG: twin-arginine translocation signal domain-containing protein, partial [Acidimicrobiia bacterium]